MSEAHTTAYVHLPLGFDAESYSERYRAGLEPDLTPYGFHHARDYGFDVVLSRDLKIPALARPRYLSRRLLGFDVIHALSNLRRIRKADIIWTMTEPEAFAISFLMWLRIAPRKPVVANAVWLMNRWNALRSWRRVLFRTLLRRVGVLTVHSEHCLPIAHQIDSKLSVRLNYFGINTDLFWLSNPLSPGSRETIRIFAPGCDRTRDWTTLLKAFGNDPRFTLVIACYWLDDEKAQRYQNLTMLREPTMRDFLQAYEETDFVAVPMVENVFSGITVALEAVATGRPVLCSRTGGVPSYFGEDAAFFTPVGDPDAMRETVLNATREEVRARLDLARRIFAERGYSTRAVMSRYAAISRELAGQNGTVSR